ncbi:MAG: hypothetical protein ACPGNV_03630 [Mangrovicoccus sp.]
MYDLIHNRELPDMEHWSRALLAEAIKCGVEFGVLIVGQGSVIGKLVDVQPQIREATILVTQDPRDRLIGAVCDTDMRRIKSIPLPALQFSLTRPANGAVPPGARTQPPNRRDREMSRMRDKVRSLLRKDRIEARRLLLQAGM